MEHPAVFDEDVLARMQDALGKDRLETILRLMLETSQADLRDLITLFHRRDDIGVRRRAHGLAGAAMSVGAIRLASAARALELAEEASIADLDELAHSTNATLNHLRHLLS